MTFQFQATSGAPIRKEIKAFTEEYVSTKEGIYEFRLRFSAFDSSGRGFAANLIDRFVEFDGAIVDSEGREVYVNTECINPDDPATIEWFRREKRLGLRPGYYTQVSYPRVIVAGTILRALEVMPFLRFATNDNRAG